MDGLLAAPVRWGDEVKTVREWLESDKCIVPPEVALLRLSAGRPIDFACTAEVIVPVKHRTSRKNKQSRFLGVYLDSRCHLWRARIKVDQKNVNVGSFRDEIIAAAAYNIAARLWLKGKERLNIM